MVESLSMSLLSDATVGCFEVDLVTVLERDKVGCSSGGRSVGERAMGERFSRERAGGSSESGERDVGSCELRIVVVESVDDSFGCRLSEVLDSGSWEVSDSPTVLKSPSSTSIAGGKPPETLLLFGDSDIAESGEYRLLDLLESCSERITRFSNIVQSPSN